MLYILYIICSSFLGVIEAMIYAKLGSDSFKWDEHYFYTAQRIFLFLIPIITFGFYINIDVVWFTIPLINFHVYKYISISLIAAAFGFPFFHDGAYYQGRKFIDNAYTGFFANTTNKFWWNLTILPRTVLFLIGLALELLIQFNIL